MYLNILDGELFLDSSIYLMLDLSAG